jgi:hypothetical protein
VKEEGLTLNFVMEGTVKGLKWLFLYGIKKGQNKPD